MYLPVNLVESHDAEWQETDEEKDDDADKHDDELLTGSMDLCAGLVRHLTTVHRVHRHLYHQQQ